MFHIFTFWCTWIFTTRIHEWFCDEENKFKNSAIKLIKSHHNHKCCWDGFQWMHSEVLQSHNSFLNCLLSHEMMFWKMHPIIPSRLRNEWKNWWNSWHHIVFISYYNDGKGDQSHSRLRHRRVCQIPLHFFIIIITLRLTLSSLNCASDQSNFELDWCVIFSVPSTYIHELEQMVRNLVRYFKS